MPRMSQLVNAKALDKMFNVLLDEDDASLHVTLRYNNDLVAEFVGVFDEQDARSALRQLFSPEIVESLTITTV